MWCYILHTWWWCVYILKELSIVRIYEKICFSFGMSLVGHFTFLSFCVLLCSIYTYNTTYTRWFFFFLNLNKLRKPRVWWWAKDGWAIYCFLNLNGVVMSKPTVINMLQARRVYTYLHTYNERISVSIVYCIYLLTQFS